jgi:hypothetical protein
MPLFGGPKKDAAFDKTNDPTIAGRDYKEFGVDEKTKATIFERKDVKDPKTDNPGVRWYLATVDEAGKFVEKDRKADKDFVYKLRAVKLKRDNAGKFVKGATSPRLTGKAHYIIEEEEVTPINFDFKKLDEHGVYEGMKPVGPGAGANASAAAGAGASATTTSASADHKDGAAATTESKAADHKDGAATASKATEHKDGAATASKAADHKDGAPAKVGGKRTKRKRLIQKGKRKNKGKSLHHCTVKSPNVGRFISGMATLPCAFTMRKGVKRYTRKVKGFRIPKKAIRNMKTWQHPIKYRKVKH